VRKLEEINPLAARLVGIRGKELEFSNSFGETREVKGVLVL